jgi:hypothetical protein
MMTEKNHIICDLDGTLSNSNHRSHLAQQGLWDEFHSAGKDDAVNESVAWLLDNSSRFGNAIVVVLTGRNERYRNATNDWFLRHRLMNVIDILIMRPDNDFSSDIDLKPNRLFDFFITKEIALKKVMVILEDRDKMVARWRDLGFDCWQTAVGTY